MNNLNENLVPVMIAFIFAIIIFAKLSDYYGYHQYHYYVEYQLKIVPSDINERYFKSNLASGFIILKNADFKKGQSHIMNLIHLKLIQNCGNCTIETNTLQIKSITRLD